ncbi:hypothetical protein BD311DRAFT_338806 [Dichomitus squalens]|uniref:F-box domain-containing protein n=1 Tax=Dichomitus squalens TaxID=114155 RepID=A0A4Q9N0M3_9APHY|nr:hypothetical protein BD311DRAFT_338806 [Dichomitus squalens]
MSSPDDFANSLHALPSVSSTVRSPALPWEVIERVIDLCSGDKNTLRTFALTCSQLHPRSLFIFFTNVELRCATQLKGFYDSVQAQSHLQPVVQSLSFPWNACSPFSLLSILPSLRHVTFDTIPGFNGLWPPPALPNYLYHRPFVTGIRSLTIRRTWFRAGTAFLHFLSAFPNVERLTCEDSSLTTSETTPMVQDRVRL